MFGRRSVILAAGTAAMFGPAVTMTSGHAAEEADFITPTVPDLNDLGTQPATTKEVAIALDILKGCPTTSPFEAMTWLAGIPETNDEHEPYNAGWKTRWNPVIVEFFKGTKTNPSGDLTPWCAASMNWVLDHCGLRGTGSASSGSFRTIAGKTGAPVRGDLVTFKAADNHEAALGKGHVALFVSQTADAVVCVGGNQVRRGHHAVMNQTIAKNGFLILDSFHSMAAQNRV